MGFRVVLETISRELRINIEDFTDDIVATFVLLHEIGHTIGSQGKNLEEITQRIKEEKSMLPELRSKPTKDELLKHAKMYRNPPYLRGNRL